MAVALISMLAIALVARVVWVLLSPLIPFLMVVVVLGGLLMLIVRGPTSRM